MAGPTPPLDLPLHSDLRILAQCGRDFLRQAHQKATHSLRLPIRRRSQAAIKRFVVLETNAEPKPFIWTADPNRVLAAVKRGKQALESIH